MIDEAELYGVGKTASRPPYPAAILPPRFRVMVGGSRFPMIGERREPQFTACMREMLGSEGVTS
jgi:hypothetical protein